MIRRRQTLPRTPIDMFTRAWFIPTHTIPISTIDTRMIESLIADA